MPLRPVGLVGLLGLVASLAACSGPDATALGAGRAGSSGNGSSSGAEADGGSTSASSGSGGASSGGSAGGDAATDAPAGSAVDPPLGGASKGVGGATPLSGATLTAQGITYRLIVPATYGGAPTPLILVFSGVEGGATMTQNLISIGPMTNTAGAIRAVLDGATYNGNGQAGATVLDEVRAKYNIDNDRTCLLGESAGTTAALALGFELRQSYFAAYWANDVNASASPAKNAAALGFAPHGQAGPGGDLADATAIVTAMNSAGYRVPTPAPYAGVGSTQHGSTDQFIAALTFLADKARK